MPAPPEKTPKSSAPIPPKLSRRLSVEDRERQIVQGAVQFFSKRGMDGQTRDLAKEIGITHPLLYHYFPTKQALVKRVYQEVYLNRWKPQWEIWLDDPDTAPEVKLVRFYQDYAATVLTPEWVRVLIFSGLNNDYIHEHYMALLIEKLLPRIHRETRRYLELPPRKKASVRENELIWGLHGGIFYIGVRRYIYNQASSEPLAAIVKDRVLSYLAGAGKLLGAGPRTCS